MNFSLTDQEAQFRDELRSWLQTELGDSNQDNDPPDAEWEFTTTGDPGWQGDPIYGQAPDAKFYKTETNFNLDLNNDGIIGFQNAAPVASSPPTTFVVKQGESLSLGEWELLSSFTDPDGDYLSIENLVVQHAQVRHV